MKALTTNNHFCYHEAEMIKVVGGKKGKESLLYWVIAGFSYHVMHFTAKAPWSPTCKKWER
eukprot:61804-Prorocentrum_lima.AAC.1